MNKAAFSLEKYRFDKVIIDLANQTSNALEVSFDPEGLFNKKDCSFNLIFTFKAFNETKEKAFVTVRCSAIFKFEENIVFEEIPTYFYRNSIAIVFPYIRSFVSTVTLQANITPLLLPTMNLSSLEKPLKDNTRQI